MKDENSFNSPTQNNGPISSQHKCPATFLECYEKYTGQYNAEKIERFVAYIKAYKEIKNISDEQSLRELQFLLENHALLWWQMTNHTFKSWQDALELMRQHFSTKKEPHEIYRELFLAPCYKHNGEDLGKQVDEKLLLFAQLPVGEQPSEAM